MKKDRAWYDARQRTLSKAAQGLVTQTLEKSQAYSDPVERAYLMGATSVSLLAAGFLHAHHESSAAAARDWLLEQLKGLAATINDLGPSKIRMTVTIEPAP